VSANDKVTAEGAQALQKLREMFYIKKLVCLCTL